MNSNNPLQDLIKKFEVPSLPQQGINSFLNESLKRAQTTTRFAEMSGDISRRIAAMASAAELSRELLYAFEFPKSPIQKLIDEAARTAAAFSKLNSFTDTIQKTMASMRAATDGIPEVLRHFDFTMSSMQKMIDAGQKVAMMSDFNRASQATDEIVRLAQLYSRPQFGGISQIIQQAMSAAQIWQSSPLGDFASRIISEPSFREAVIQRLESEEFPGGRSEDTQISSQDVLDAVERGIEESMTGQHSDNIQESVNSMFSWWAKLPPDLRTIAISFLVGLLLLITEYCFFVKDRPTVQLTINQHVKIVQKITNNIFVNVGVSPNERGHFRIVTKDELPVFHSNRRDSMKIGKLRAAQVVTVKTQKRNWTQVEWKDADNKQIMTGWVFTRYLKKI